MITGYKERWPVIIFKKITERNHPFFKEKKSDKNEICLTKCKQIYTNKTETVDEIPILVSAWSFKNYIFKVTECKDAELFSDSSLKSFMRNSIADSIDGVAAYSLNKNKVKMRYKLLSSSDESAALYILDAVSTEIFSKCDSLKKIDLSAEKCESAIVSRGDEILILEKP